MNPRFSRRLDWRRAENALAVAESARRRAGLTVLDLTESNPTKVDLSDPGDADALSAALATELSSVYAPTPRGPAAARLAVADQYSANGTPVAPERVMLTASSSESYSFLWKLLCDPGDAVLVPEPSYPLFEYLARLEGVAAVPYRFDHDGTAAGTWNLDLGSVDRAVASSRARIGAIVIVSPNNPTGSVLRADDLAALDQRAVDLGAALVADEVFADYVARPTPARVRCLAAHATDSLSFSLGGLSKGCGLPQLKLGWIAVGGPALAVEAALAGLDLIGDTFLSVGTQVAASLPALLRMGAAARDSINRRLAQNRHHLMAAIGDDSPLTVLRSEGGWAAIVRLPAIHTDEQWALALLEKDGVLVHPGYFFDLRGPTFVVLSLIVAPEVFQEGVRRLVARVSASIS